jgi:hypothetical protein
VKGWALEAFFFRLVVELRFVFPLEEPAVPDLDDDGLAFLDRTRGLDPFARRDADFFVGMDDLLRLKGRMERLMKLPVQKNSTAALMSEKIDEGKVRQARVAPILLEAAGGRQSL